MLTKKIRGFQPDMLKHLFLVNPVVVLVFCAFLGNVTDFWASYFVSLEIATIVYLFCNFIQFFVVTAESVWYRRRGLAAPLHSRAWHMVLALIAMPVGLWIAFSIVHFHLDWSDYRAGILLGTVICGLFFLLYTRRDAIAAAKDAQLKIQQIENERLNAQLSALTSQMNPHLLFNALNTVASLVPTDPQRAEDTIVRLAELYRGVLEAGHRTLHPLSRELEICEAYLEVERARFGERLGVEISVEDSGTVRDMLVPVLCLQPLVENAIKHGLAPLAEGGRVRIEASLVSDSLVVRVVDNGVGLGSGRSKPGSGTAIRNCRERLRLHYGSRAAFEMGPSVGQGTCVELRIPVAEPQRVEA